MNSYLRLVSEMNPGGISELRQHVGGIKKIADKYNAKYVSMNMLADEWGEEREVHTRYGKSIENAFKPLAYTKTSKQVERMVLGGMLFPKCITDANYHKKTVYLVYGFAIDVFIECLPLLKGIVNLSLWMESNAQKFEARSYWPSVLNANMRELATAIHEEPFVKARIIAYLVTHPEASTGEIARDIGVSQQDASYHELWLRKNGITERPLTVSGQSAKLALSVKGLNLQRFFTTLINRGGALVEETEEPTKENSRIDPHFKALLEAKV